MNELPVCFVSSHGRRGGSERYLRSLLGGLEPGWRSSVVVLEEGDLAADLRRDGVDPIVRDTSGSKLAMLAAARWLRRHLDRTRPALVHANGVKAAAIAVAATAGRRAPVVWVKHDFSWDGPLGALIGRRAALVVGVSQAVLRPLPAAARTTVVPTGVAVPALDTTGCRALVDQLGPRRPVLTLVGRLDPFKGHRDLLAAAPQGTGLLFVGGDDPAFPDAGDGIRAAAGDRAVFTGHRDDAVQLMAGSDVLVMPSGPEGFGLVAVEAMAAGVPVVAYAAGALPETVGDAGLLVPPGDVRALGKALESVLGDDALRNQLVARGRARAAERFGVDRWLESMRDAYRRSRSIGS